MNGYVNKDLPINCNLSGRIHFPERPIYLELCTFVDDDKFIVDRFSF